MLTFIACLITAIIVWIVCSLIHFVKCTEIVSLLSTLLTEETVKAKGRKDAHMGIYDNYIVWLDVHNTLSELWKNDPSFFHKVCRYIAKLQVDKYNRALAKHYQETRLG